MELSTTYVLVFAEVVRACGAVPPSSSVTLVDVRAIARSLGIQPSDLLRDVDEVAARLASGERPVEVCDQEQPGFILTGAALRALVRGSSIGVSTTSLSGGGGRHSVSGPENTNTAKRDAASVHAPSIERSAFLARAAKPGIVYL